MSNHCVLAQVVDVENYKHAIYSCCPVCSGRVFYSCDSWICRKCHYRCDANEFCYRLRLLIFDGTDFINISVFGHHLEPFFGCSANKFKKYLYSYELEQIGQAVCNTFIGEWFLFGIQAATTSYTGMRSLCRSSTPYSRHCRQQVKPRNCNRFSVWQMALPSDTSASFVTVVSHLAAVCGVNGSSQVDLSRSLSILALTDAEHLDALSEASRLQQLYLSCDEWNGNSTCTLEQSAELTFSDDAVAAVSDIILTTPCDVQCSACDSRTFPVRNTSLDCLCDIRSSSQCDVHLLAQHNSRSVHAECELETLSSFHAGTVCLPTVENSLTESFELFDVVDSFHESATDDTVACYSEDDFTAEILFCSPVTVPAVSSVPKKRGSDGFSTESSSSCFRCGTSSDNKCSCSNFAEHALNAEDKCHDYSLTLQCRHLADAADNRTCKLELVCACVTCGCSLASNDKHSQFAPSEDEFSLIAGISTLDIDAITDTHDNM